MRWPSLDEGYLLLLVVYDVGWLWRGFLGDALVLIAMTL